MSSVTPTKTASKWGLPRPVADPALQQNLQYLARGLLNVQTESASTASGLRADLNQLNTDLGGFTADGILTDAEKQAITQDRKRLAADQQKVEAQYAALSNNPGLTGAAKADLDASHTTYQGKTTDLDTALDNLLAAEAITSDLTDAYDAAFTTYVAALSDFSSKVQAAVDAIKAAGVAEAKSYTDAQLAPVAQAAADATTAAAGAQATADGKVTTFFAASAPTAEGVGDLWVRTSDGNKLYRWDGVQWTVVQDAGIAQAISAAGTAQSTADGKIVTFYQTSAPTAKAVGDLWIDTDDSNRLYRWSGSSWVDVRDSGIAQAISAASGAQATANGKITTFFQTSAPTALAVGDLWLDTDDGNHLYRWNGASWASVQDQGIGTALANAATAQETADGKIQSFCQTSAPAASGLGVGDLWTDSDDSNKLYRWDGSAWVSVRDGGATKADGAIDGNGNLSGGLAGGNIAHGVLWTPTDSPVSYGQGSAQNKYKTIHIPGPQFASLVAGTGGLFFDGAVYASTAPVTWIGAVIMPLGATITAFRVRMYRGGTSDQAVAYFSRVGENADDNNNATALAVCTHDVVGWATYQAILSESVAGTNGYVARIDMGAGSTATARLLWVELDYAVTDYAQSY